MSPPSFRLAPIALAIASAAVGCRAPKGPGAGDFQPAPLYAALFAPFNHWTYNVASGPATPDEASGTTDEAATSIVIKCRADEVKPFKGGVTSHIACDAPRTNTDDMGSYPLEGVWMANEDGLWHVHPGAPPSLDNATLVIRATPSEGNIDPDELTLDDTFGSIARDGDAWCATHRQVHDGETYYTLCFAPEGVRSGRYGVKGEVVRETRFELAR